MSRPQRQRAETVLEVINSARLLQQLRDHDLGLRGLHYDQPPLQDPKVWGQVVQAIREPAG